MRQHGFSKKAVSAAAVPALLISGLALGCGALSAMRSAEQADACAPAATVTSARCLLLKAGHKLRQEARYHGPTPLRGQARRYVLLHEPGDTLPMYFAS